MQLPPAEPIFVEGKFGFWEKFASLEIHPPSLFEYTPFCLWGFGLLVRITGLFCVRGLFMIFRVLSKIVEFVSFAVLLLVNM